MKLDTSKPVSIPLSKFKMILLSSLAVGFVALSLWLWSITGLDLFSLIIKFVSLVGISFFGLCTVSIFFKIFDMKPGLVIDQEGFLDNSTTIASGNVPWSEIVEIDTFSVNNQKFLIFMVVDPKKYANQGNFLQRKIKQLNLKLFGSSIQISANSLKTNFFDLKETVDRYYSNYKKHHQKAEST